MLSRRLSLLSVLWIDPGMTTGWAWTALLGQVPNPPRGGVVSGSPPMRRLDLRSGQMETSGNWQEEAYGVARIFELISRSTASAEKLATRSLENVEADLRVVVGVEGFSLRERTKDRSLLSPVRLTAGLHQMLYLHPNVWDAIEEQSPSDKSIIKDDQLKAAGVYEKGKPHSNDAHRHRILWERKTLGVPNAG